MRLLRLLVVAVLTLSTAASAGRPPRTGRPRGVLATGRGLQLTPLGRMVHAQRRTSLAIAGARTTIQRLGQHILRLEAQLREKLAQSDQLMSQLGRRASTLDKTTAWFGLLAIVAAATPLGLAVTAAGGLGALDSHLRHRDVRARIAVLAKEREQIDKELQRHRAEKSLAEGELATLQLVERRFDGQLAALSQRVGGTPRSLEDAKALLDTSRELHDNLKQQIGILKTTRNRSASLAQTLDAHVRHLEADLAHADRLVKASHHAVIEYLAILVSKNPEAAAKRWLNRRVTSEAARVLRSVGLGARGDVEMLAGRAIRGGGAPDEVLRDQFVDAVLATLKDR